MDEMYVNMEAVDRSLETKAFHCTDIWGLGTTIKGNMQKERDI